MYLCVFYLSFLELGLVIFVFFVLSTDECYFAWPFVKVDFVKKNQNLIETISSNWHSGTILCVELGFSVFLMNAILRY